jgi:hypothetical protein
MINDKLFIFKKDFAWKMDESFKIESGFPVRLRQIFPKLPKRFKSIDAVYEQRDFESPVPSILIFSGKYNWN